jgi:hypothetical protein
VGPGFDCADFELLGDRPSRLHPPGALEELLKGGAPIGNESDQDWIGVFRGWERSVWLVLTAGAGR